MLSFCYCIRSRYADVNIFYSDQVAATDTMRIENITAKMTGLLARVALPASFTSGFDLLEQKDKFNDTLESWLTGDSSSKFPNGSIVALCCSNLLSIHFQEELLDDDLLPEFQKFLLATTLAHSGWTARDMKKRELCAAGHISGYRLITRLDRILTPQFLSQCSPEYCQVLFLLLLGTILGVGYSSSQLTESESSSRQFPPSPTAAADMLDTEFQQSPTLWLAMKEHLCQMLAHHLIFLASMLGIKLDTGVERRIIDTAIQRWSKMESFVWADGVENADHERDREREMARRRAEFTASQINPPYATTQPTHSPQKQAQVVYDQNPPYWQQSSAAQQPQQDAMIQGRQPPLVPISCPEITQFQTSFPQWSENPASYLNMEMDEESPPSSVPPPPPPPQPTSQGQGPDNVAISPFETAESRSAPSLEPMQVYAEPEMVIQTPTPPMQTQAAGEIDWNIMNSSNIYNTGTGTGNNARSIQPRPGQVVRSQTEPIPQSRVECKSFSFLFFPPFFASKVRFPVI